LGQCTHRGVVLHLGVLLREPNTEGLVDLVTRELQTAEWILADEQLLDRRRRTASDSAVIGSARSGTVAT
jgi:hypothetical protein